MKTTDPTPLRAGAGIEFLYDGNTIRAYDGETIAAALTANGARGLRRTSVATSRGIFCGMGVCAECLLTVDGVPNRRACMTIVRNGMAVRPQEATVQLEADASLPTATDATPEIRTPQVLVVGGGPAGLCAALAASESGAEVVILDERPTLGGQYFKQPASPLAAGPTDKDRQFERGRALIESVRRSSAQILSDAIVWGAFPPNEIAVIHDDHQALYRPAQLIIATGAYERGVPFPGWTLPGVMTAGAAQTVLRAYGVAPGQRVLVAGNGPLNLQVAVELGRAGGDVVAIAETARRPNLSHVPAIAAAYRHDSRLMRDGLAYRRELRRRRVPILYRHAIAEVSGNDQVAAAIVARIDDDGRPVAGSDRRFDVDTVTTGYGFLPQSDIARALGCAHFRDPATNILRCTRDEDGATSVPGVFVAGDSGGTEGAQVARHQGWLAGFAAAAAADACPSAELARERREQVEGLQRARRFQEALWRIFAGPPMMSQMARSDTLICRCENVSLQALEEALATGLTTVGALKRQTRAGMGRCQARYCGPVMEQMVASATARAPDEWSAFAPRPPIKPLRLVDIAKEPSGGTRNVIGQ